ncbi:MAG: hypothetical protein A2Z34_03240 [Planctomycetes bacterium RBG_16_59_8]|nr:MAG: hypothetical protein A2Z34_03240 [Planctomycetes bacterium RBG_16_59_8]
MEENFAFALPGHAVQIGDRWSANGHALVQFIGKTTHQTLKRIKACSLECRLVSISPSREAVIELGLGYEAEHLSGALVYETRGCFGGTLRFDAAAGRVLHVTLEGRDLAVSAYPNGDPSASPTLNGSASISLDITYR